MSVGLQLLTSIMTHGSREAFRHLSVDFFTEDEHPAFNFINGFFERHGGLPSIVIMRENGFNLPAADGPVSYYQEAMTGRSIYQAYTRRQNDLFECFRTNRMLDARQMIEDMLVEMRGSAATPDTFTLTTLMDQVWAEYEEARTRLGMVGLPFGWPTVDEHTGGMRQGELTTIVARPGVAKSYAITRSACSAWQTGASILFISMEMAGVEIAKRILAMGSGVNPDFITRGTVSAWGEEHLIATMERVGRMPPWVMMVGNLTKSTRDVDAMIQEHRPDGVYIDASYLLKGSKATTFRGKRFEVVSETMRELQDLCIRHNRAICQTVQFNRSQKDDDDFSLDNIGQTDEIGQLSAAVLAIKKGKSPHERTRRRFGLPKNRHGEDGIGWDTHFLFSPFNMDEIEAGGDETSTELYDETNPQGEQPPAQDWHQ